MKRYPMTALLAEQKKHSNNIFPSSYHSVFRSLLYIPILFFLIATPIIVAPSSATAQEELTVLNADLHRMPIPIQMQLIAHTQRYVNSIAKNVIPNQKSKNVVKRGNEFVARYLVIDVSTATMEALPLERGKNYKAIISYHELEYQCRGATKDAALNGTFSHKKTRRLIEVLQYTQGRWR